MLADLYNISTEPLTIKKTFADKQVTALANKNAQRFFFWLKITHLEEKSNKLIFYADKARRRWQKLTCSFTLKRTVV